MNNNVLVDVPHQALHINQKKKRFIILEICQSASAFLLKHIHATFVLQCTQVPAKCSWFLEIRVKLSSSALTPPPVLFCLSLAPGSLLAPLTH